MVGGGGPVYISERSKKSKSKKLHATISGGFDELPFEEEGAVESSGGEARESPDADEWAQSLLGNLKGFSKFLQHQRIERDHPHSPSHAALERDGEEDFCSL